MLTLLKNNTESTRVDSMTTFQEKHRIVPIFESISDEVALRIISELDYFSQKKGPIYLLINSPGGSISAGYSILDYCRLVPNKIITIGIGSAASMGSFLLTCAGDERYVTDNCELLYHQPLVGHISGQATDVEIQTKHLLQIKNKVIQDLSKKSNLSTKKLKDLLDRDSWLSKEDALKYNLIDGVLDSLPYANEE